MRTKTLRTGFTTGTCAAAAAKAAAFILLSGETAERTEITTPAGVRAEFGLREVHVEAGRVSCAVEKEAGDDPDVTDRALVYASVEYGVEALLRAEAGLYHCRPGLYLGGGAGVGTVTRPGLSCPVGMPAINPVPRQMITEAVAGVCSRLGFNGCLLIRIIIPAGVSLAERTFNPKLGIAGGISVLGTTGIVEPMSERALLETIRLEIHMKAAGGCGCLALTPGNYGEAFLKGELGISLEEAVKCSNFIGEAVEAAAAEEIGEILLAGHVGKLVKVAGGVRNTHSKYGDRRMEILRDCVREAFRAGQGEREALERELMASNTTEEALARLYEAGAAESSMERLARRAKGYAEQWAGGKTRVEVVTFSTVYGILGVTSGAMALASKLQETERRL